MDGVVCEALKPRSFELCGRGLVTYMCMFVVWRMGGTGRGAGAGASARRLLLENTFRFRKKYTLHDAWQTLDDWRDIDFRRMEKN